jgi:predicted nucleic acid-binding Zn ribbon protein
VVIPRLGIQIVIQVRIMDQCKHEDCIASGIKKGYCERHYRQARRRGLVGWDGTICAEEGCSRPAVSRKRCEPHYARLIRSTAPECSVDVCTSPASTRGWCQKHYMRFIRHGDPLAWTKPKRGICSVEGCNVKHAAHGLCQTHNRRLRRYGTTDLPPKPVIVLPAPYSCRQCGNAIAPGRGRRGFCSRECRERWNYWERRRTHRTRWLKKYGLTVAQYESMIAAQAGRCAVCGDTDPKTNGGKHWAVDHDHTTGESADSSVTTATSDSASSRTSQNCYAQLRGIWTTPSDQAVRSTSHR